MAGNPDLIIGGVAGGDGATGLAWFAVHGTAGPTDATTALAAAFKDAGIVADSGLTEAISENTTTVNGFGLSTAARKFVTSTDQTFELTFLESNPISVAVYNRLPLDALTVSALGAFDLTTGSARSIRYAAVFDLLDGLNHRRVFAPDIEVTGRGNKVTAPGGAVSYPVTLTAYTGSDGVATHEFYLLDALAS